MSIIKSQLSKNPITLLVIGTMMCASVIYYGLSRVNIVVSPSIDHRIFITSNSEAKKGDYALFEINNEALDIKNKLVTKIIACGPGDYLSTENGTVTCNNEILGIALKTNAKGKKLPQFDFNGIIPAGKGYAHGSSPYSFDSRYFGLIDLNQTKKEYVII